ncbi:MAG: lysozyme [Cyanobacteria bacterium P01_C01_bin.120]
MGTWIKETPKAIYLMEGGYWISRLSKYPSSTNPSEQVLNISAIRSWFTRSDYPRAMTVSSTGPEPSPKPAPPKPIVQPPTSGSKIPQSGLNLIKEFEGFRANAYADPIHGWGVPTIGYGTIKYPDGRQVQRGDTVTREQAERYLIDHVEEELLDVMQRIPTWSQMNDNQRGALYSFAYNLGKGFYRGNNFQSITRVIDSPNRWRDRAWVTEQFVKYRNPGTPAEAGLRRRRIAEANLFTS